ncbi:uncharacterized protein LOC124306907 [Neodiprion virginianus]|uniref:uncharacterized protein LOC124306907 n=1 Tax=Neodiprion virginianus TaxID=2961670 RepID=UPI001EE6C955|nr:uncharacterized protein LOC124306907 [Neodiprion virginianus]XP_046624026.1 uncharacterized protein LOC124306907 [Neodiprion virginianus]XP_046624027.1 uncharacterized protein LOC124306907 [Neodiprion virginianus]XP_046624028.1 uncharacterized protein LOC124306907 [Neodiprion virginianus]XP_046624029.1 uncharacterized protein LOC124306907 [Neodiprion virginianus]XP_046624030.1 uncharacterized protein LOC124306907 [Neodiprion virginianus]
MAQRSPIKNSPSTKALQFHQVEKQESQHSESPSPNQRVLILSTPVKLKDGTVNMKQRTIPLRVDNSQLMIKAGENKSRVVSLKRNHEAVPLALPINQLNQKTPTFVKNEVGQVMGKLIPLGKFSNISPNTLSPANPTPASASTSPIVSDIGVKNLRNEMSKQNTKSKGYKLVKLDEKVIGANAAAAEKFEEILKSKQKTNTSSTCQVATKHTATASPTVVTRVKNAEDQLITITDDKPKKQVHLVLKGYENIASIGQTGTNIKLIPLEQWGMDTKLNFLKTQSRSSFISQPKIVDVRSCAIDEIDGLGDSHFDDSKLNHHYDKGDFDSDDVLEKDPLDIEGLSKETSSFHYLLDKNAEEDDNDSPNALETKKLNTIDVIDFECNTSAMGGLSDVQIATLVKNKNTSSFKLDNPLNPESNYCPKKSSDLLEDSNNCSASSKIAVKGTKEHNPVIDGLTEKSSKDDIRFEQKYADYENLCKQFRINQHNVTSRETEMLSYIHNLKKKLFRFQKNRYQTLAAIEQREYLGISNLSTIQKRFIETQLRNSNKTSKKPRFTKTDIVMARDILKATGPRGYNNLRKLFSLPGISIIVKGISKT